jgi:hypothetical protein
MLAAMSGGMRRAIAYISGRAISGRAASAVYDYGTSGFFNFSGDVSADRVQTYDYERGCYVGGSLSALFDYSTNTYVLLTIRGEEFDGYDYASGARFIGRLTGQSVSIYDYETGRHHAYSI